MLAFQVSFERISLYRISAESRQTRLGLEERVDERLVVQAALDLASCAIHVGLHPLDTVLRLFRRKILKKSKTIFSSSSNVLWVISNL